MTVKSTRRKGLQSRGNTPIDGDFTISKSGTVVEVSSGTFIDVNGNEYTVPQTSVDVGTSTEIKEIGIWLYEDKNGNTHVEIGEKRPNNVIQMLVAPDWFIVPANTSDLSNVDMYAFGWIDSHPKEIVERLPDNAEAVAHRDLQKLKRNGNELTLENVPDVALQKPEKPENSNSVRPV